MFKLYSLLAAALLLALGATVAQAADGPTNDTPQNAVVLSGTVSGDIAAIPPNLGVAHHAFLTFQYPGDNSLVTVNVNLAPGDPAAAHNAGVLVYGPTNGKLYARGGQTGKHPSYEAQFRSTEAGWYLVEIDNANLVPLHYTATATGLPPQPSAAPVAAAAANGTAAAPPTPTPVPVGQNKSADRATALTGPVSATLAGSPAGSFHFYSFTYPGDGSTARIDLDVSPADPQTGQSAGFVVYGPIPGREYARGAYQGPDAPTHSTTLVTNEPGTYVVQIYNYGSSPIAYRLDVSGLPAQPAAQAAPSPTAAAGTPNTPATSGAPVVGLNTTPDQAVNLTAPVSAVLPGGPPTSSHYYRFSSPGGGAAYRIDLDVAPSDPTTGQAAGFVVFGPTPGRQYAAGAYQGGSPTHTATLQTAEPGVYLVQVFNNNPSAVGYRLTLQPG